MSLEYKGFQIVKHPRFTTQIIKTVGRGSLPNRLEGAFVSQLQAKNAIDVYVMMKEMASSKKPKGSVDDQTVSADRGQ